MAPVLDRGAREVEMVVAVELRNMHRRPVFVGPQDQVDALRVIAHDSLLGSCLMSTHVHLMWVPEIAHAIGWDERRPQRISLELTVAAVAVLTMWGDSRLRPTGDQWWIVPAEARGPALWAEWREKPGWILRAVCSGCV